MGRERCGGASLRPALFEPADQGGQPTVQGLGIPIHPDIVGAGMVEMDPRHHGAG